MNADQIYSYLSNLKLKLLIGSISDYKKNFHIMWAINIYARVPIQSAPKPHATTLAGQEEGLHVRGGEEGPQSGEMSPGDVSAG